MQYPILQRDLSAQVVQLAGQVAYMSHDPIGFWCRKCHIFQHFREGNTIQHVLSCNGKEDSSGFDVWLEQSGFKEYFVKSLSKQEFALYAYTVNNTSRSLIPYLMNQHDAFDNVLTNFKSRSGPEDPPGSWSIFQTKRANVSWDPYIHILQQALEAEPDDTSVQTLYRGTNRVAMKPFHEGVGKIIQWLTVTSTSSQEEEAIKSMNKELKKPAVLFKITPNSYRKRISQYTDFQDDKEYVFPPNSLFRLLKLPELKGWYYEVSLEYITPIQATNYLNQLFQETYLKNCKPKPKHKFIVPDYNSIKQENMNSNKELVPT